MNGEIEMTPVQIQAAKILLSKVAPDLTSVSGEIAHMHSADLVRQIILTPIEPAHSGGPKLVEAKAETVELEPIRLRLTRD